MNRIFLGATMLVAALSFGELAVAQQSTGTTSGQASGTSAATTNGQYNQAVQGNTNDAGGKPGTQGAQGAESGAAPGQPTKSQSAKTPQ
jgi:hypothetical protein